MNRKRKPEPKERKVGARPTDDALANLVEEAKRRGEPVSSTVRREALEVIDEIVAKVESGRLRDR